MGADDVVHGLRDYGLRITDYGLRITDYGLRITDYGLRITDYGRVTDEGMIVLNSLFALFEFLCIKKACKLTAEVHTKSFVHS
jgi:hypothetical protein